MYNSHREGGASGWKGPKSFGEKFRATCASCGNSCEVPFKPNGSRPVYCRDCFKKEGAGDSHGFGGRDSARPSFGDKPMSQAVCSSCGDRCEVPFRPAPGQAVYCKACFGSHRGDNIRVSKPEENHADQFKAINAKLDAILKVLSPAAPAAMPKAEAAAPKEAKAEPKAEPKTEKAKKTEKVEKKKAAPKKKK